ncbi:MAG TPA: S8 family serine peptidase [Baekduia sp.]|nr:S8 family serine peptidase [Baekduia sp.]
MTRTALLGSLVAALLVLAAPASGAVPRWQSFDRVPHELPGAGAHAAAATGWIVGARPGRRAARIARVHGAHAIGRIPGAYALPTGRARAFAEALRAQRLLRYAEPDRLLAPASSYERPDGPSPWARSFIVGADLTPPAKPAPIGIVDDLVDASVPDTSQATIAKHSATRQVLDGHGTAVASVAAGKADGQGVIGIMPGAPIISFGLKTSSCSEVAKGIDEIALSDAEVLNLSLGTTDDCFLLELAVADAIYTGTLVIAASGNELESGNPIVYPAAYPHVLSVGAVDVMKQPTYFSSTNSALDLAAPGDEVPVALPLAFDTKDGVADGVSTEDGTSFAAPVVSGVASWLIAARPGLGPGQYADLLRHTATDLGDPGWDASTGFGLVNLAGALQAPTPKVDPLEPNDGITYVDGTAYGKPARYVWKGGRARALKASVDAVEDPTDVYRIRLPRHRRATITLVPGAGNADLRLYDGRAKGLQVHPLSRSSRGPGARDVVHVVNHRRKAHSYYVAVVAPSVKSRSFDAQYDLRFTRR